MNFEVTDSLGLIKTGLTEVGSYMEFERPLAVVWSDNGGSDAQFLALLPYSETYRTQVHKQITGSLYEDFTGRLEEALNRVRPLLMLFEKGNYYIGFSNAEDKHFFKR